MEEKFELPTAGEVLLEEFLEPLNITPYRLSKDLGMSTSSILDLVHGKRKITAEMAVRLSKYFGTTSKFWLNIQNELDLREAESKVNAFPVTESETASKKGERHPSDGSREAVRKFFGILNGV